MKKRCRLLCLMILLVCSLLPAMNLMAQEQTESPETTTQEMSSATETQEQTKNYEPAELTVFYHEYSRKNITASPDHMSQKISSIESEEITPDSELFVKDHTEVLLQLVAEDFDPAHIQLLIYEEDYSSGKKTEVSKHFYHKENWKKTGTSCYYLALDFAEEGHYQMVISYRDAGGQQLQPGDNGTQTACFVDGVYYGPHYTVDLTDPDVGKAVPLMTPLLQKDDISCFADTASYEIVIGEENFHPQYFHWTGNSDGITMSSWDTFYEDGIRKNRMTFTADKEGRYDLGWEYRDGSGRQASAGDCRFLLDRTDPEVSLSPASGSNLLRYSYEKIQIFSKKPIVYEISAKDAVSGIREITYTYSRKDGDLTQVTKKNESSDNNFSLKAEIPSGDYCGSLTVKATDFMGRESELLKSPVFLWESEATSENSSELEIFLSDPVREDKDHHILYYQKAPTVTMKAKSSCAGIRDSYLSASFQGKEQKEKKRYDQSKQISEEIEQVRKLVADDFERSCKENPIYISGGFTDNAGYETEKRLDDRKIVVDGIAPNISVSFSEDNEKECYASTRSAVVTVEDINFDPSQVSWHISGPSRGYVIGSWQGKGKKHWCKVDFTGDGKYHLGISVSDYSGNSSSWEQEGSFAIDKTLPRVILWMDQSDLKHDRYYATHKKVYLFVADSNVTKEGVHLYKGKTQELSLQVENKPHISEKLPDVLKDSSWKIYSCSIGKEGTYHISGSCEDEAGNQSETAVLAAFTIDLTKPEIITEHLSANMTFTDQVNPEVRISDKYLQKNTADVTLYYKDGTRVLSLERNMERSEDSSGKTKGTVIFYWKDFPRKKEIDNGYILKVRACDLAGNEQTVEIPFYVDRFGVRYVTTKETDAILEQFYQKEEADIRVKAYSLHPQNTEILLTYNNEEFRVLNTDEYESESSILDGTETLPSGEAVPEKYKGWYETEYRILKKVFEEEGDYQITIRSRERTSGEAGNLLTESENTLWTEPLHIAIDRTPPSVFIGGLEDEVYDAASIKYTVSAMDNTRLKKVRIYVRKSGDSGTGSYELYTEKDFDEQHSITAQLNAYAGYQFVGYEAWDYAGNYSTSLKQGQENKVLVTASPVVRAHYEHPYLTALIILLLLSIAGLSIFLTRRYFSDIVR